MQSDKGADKVNIGAQLYTVREFTKDLDGFSETLKKVSDIGYRYVQVSGTCAFDGEWLAGELRKNGLKCAVTHTPAGEILEEPEKTAEKHKEFGCEYIGLGWNAFDLSAGDTPAEFIKKYLPAAEKISRAGCKFMYHNHDQEFKKVDGRLIIDILSEAFSEDIMGFIVDTFWVQAAGGDPAQWVKKLSGRVPCVHLKDFSYGRKFAALGEGNMNFPAIFKAAEEAGTEYMLVEQDDCYGEDPFECLRRSYEYLKAMGFE